MKQVNIYEAKSILSKLIDEVERGEEVIIARSGVPVVKLVRMSPAKRKFGQFAQHDFRLDREKFAQADQAIADLFEGEND